MGFLLKKLLKNNHIGVAVTDDGINLARVEKRGGVFHVAETRSLPLDHMERLGLTLTEMGCHGLPATISLQDELFTSRTLNLPGLSSREIKKVVQRELSVEAKEGRLAAWSITEDGNDETITLRSLDRPLALEWLRHLREAGQAPHRIVPHALAFCSAALLPGELASGELISLLDIWDHHADLVLIRDGIQIYHRRISRGWSGTQYDAEPPPQPAAPPPTAPPSDYGNVSLPDATGDTDAAPSATPSSPPENDSPTVGPEPANAVWQRLGEEIRRTHLFAKKNLQAGEVVRTVLTGPVTAAHREWVAQTIGLESATLAEHRTDLTWEHNFDARHATAVGAAVRGLAGSLPNERLVPPEMIRQNTQATMASATAALLVCLITLAGFGIYNEAQATATRQVGVSQLEQTLASMESTRPVARNAKQDALAAALQRIPDPFPGSALLSVMGHALPGNAQLSYMGAEWRDGWQIEVEGEVKAPPVSALQSLGRLVTDLQHSDLFSSVELLPVSAGNPDTGFKLNLTLASDHG